MRQYTVEEAFPSREAARLDCYLATQAEKSRAYVQRQIQNGGVQVNGQPITKRGLRLKPGDTIQAHFQPDPELKATAAEGPLDILYEDEALLCLNKPVDQVVHPSAGHSEGTLVHALLYYFQNDAGFRALHEDTTTAFRPGIVHRLDKGTSGVLLVAKTRKVQEALSDQFKQRTIQKEYRTLVWGAPLLEGHSDRPIGRHFRNRKKMSSHTYQGRPSLTHWKRLPFDATTSKSNHTPLAYLAVFPHTGRTHQIRVHLSEAGFPIVGDPLYGNRKRGALSSLPTLLAETLAPLEHPLLHAHTLNLTHPTTKKPLHFTAPIPKTFQNVLTLLAEFDKK